MHDVDLSFEMITLPGKIYLSYTFLMIGCQGNRTVLTANNAVSCYILYLHSELNLFVVSF